MSGAPALMALMLGGFAAAIAIPGVVAAEAGASATASRFLGTALVTGFIAGGVYFSVRGRADRGSRRLMYGLAAIMFVAPPIAGAVPFLGATGGDVVAALFEAFSGFTTTGATVFSGRLDGLEPAILLWRAELQWLGGLATLVVLVAFLAPLGAGGLPARAWATAAATPGPRLAAALRDCGQIYGAVTLACILALMTSGIPAFDALCLALATVSTGGFMPHDGGVTAYGNPAAEIVLIVFMLVGATSVLWHRMLAGGRWQQLAAHRESYLVIAAALAVGLLYAVALLATPMAGEEGEAVRTGLLSGVSLLTTTGFPTGGTGYAVLPLTFAVIVALAGAGAFSTAGGIKFYRLGGMMVEASHELRRLIYPHAVRSARFGSQPVDAELMKALWSQLAAAMAVLAAATLALTFFGMDFEAASVAAVSAFANIGGLFVAGWPEAGGWPGYAALGDSEKLVLIATMVAGRLEAIALVGAVGAALWRI